MYKLPANNPNDTDPNITLGFAIACNPLANPFKIPRIAPPTPTPIPFTALPIDPTMPAALPAVAAPAPPPGGITGVGTPRLTTGGTIGPVPGAVATAAGLANGVTVAAGAAAAGAEIAATPRNICDV